MVEVKDNFREGFSRYNRYFRKITDTYSAKPQVKKGVEVMLSAVLVAFFALFALRPTISTIADLWSQIKTQKEISARLDEKISSLQKAKQIFTQEKANIALLDQSLPKKSQPIQFLQQVEGYIAKADVAIEAFTLDNIAIYGDATLNSAQIKGKAPSTNIIRISLTLQGSYDNLLAFLKDSEELRRIIEVDTVTFGETKESKITGDLSLTITGNTSYLRRE